MLFLSSKHEAHGLLLQVRTISSSISPLIPSSGLFYRNSMWCADKYRIFGCSKNGNVFSMEECGDYIQKHSVNLCMWSMMVKIYSTIKTMEIILFRQLDLKRCFTCSHSLLQNLLKVFKTFISRKRNEFSFKMCFLGSYSVLQPSSSSSS